MEEFEGYKVPECTEEEVKRVLSTGSCKHLEDECGEMDCTGEKCLFDRNASSQATRDRIQRYLDHRYPQKVAVHCATQEEWDRVQEKARNEGYRWLSGNESMKYVDSWNYLGLGEGKTLMRGDRFNLEEVSGYKIISAQEYLGEAKGRPKCSRCGSDTRLDSDTKHWAVVCLDRRCKQFKAAIYHSNISDAEEFWVGICKRNTINNSNTKEEDMNDAITEVYENTKDAVLVNKHFGKIMGNTFTTFTATLWLTDKKKEYLTEAKRLEEEANKE